MRTEFQIPHITGNTAEQKISQIIAYLRQTAYLLQALPDDRQERQKEKASLRSCSFPSLRVESHIRMKGGINGIYLQRVAMGGRASFAIQSAGEAWEGSPRQSLLLAGSCGTPVLGVLVVEKDGSCLWNGSQGVSVAAEPKGVVRVTFPEASQDLLMLQSALPFRVL